MHLLQACARAYGEREVLGACVQAMNQVTLPPRSARLLGASSRGAQMPLHITPSDASVCSQQIAEQELRWPCQHAAASPPACQVYWLWGMCLWQPIWHLVAIRVPCTKRFFDAAQSKGSCMQAPRSVSCVLQPLITLWALRQVEINMGWLLTEGLIPVVFAKAVPNHIR